MTAIVNKTLLALLLIIFSIPTAHAQKSPKPKKPKRLSVKQQLTIERMRADSLAALVDEYRDREDRLANNRRAAQATNEKPIRNETTYIAYTPERADSLAELLHLQHSDDAFQRFFDDYICEPAEVIGDEDLDSLYAERLKKMVSPIHLPYNPLVRSYIKRYTDSSGLMSRVLALSKYYFPMIDEELLKAGLPVELHAMAIIESALQAKAYSRAGAAGLWQFIPTTAKAYGLEINSMVDERYDAVKSTKAACRYMKNLYDMYDDWSLAIAAYNCGPGNVNKALRRAGGGTKDFWEIYEYLPAETRGYVPCFIAANFVMNYHDRYGIHPSIAKHDLVTDTVGVNDRIHFNQIAAVLDIPVDELRLLNPQFCKDIIPGDYHTYYLTLPQGKIAGYLTSYDNILAYDSDIYQRRTYVEPGQQRTDNGQNNALNAAAQTQNADSNAVIPAMIADNYEEKIHVVGRGENLRDIAKKYGVSATDLKRWNKLRRGKVKEGDQLVVHVYERDLAEASTAPTTESTVTTTVEPEKPRKDSKKNSDRKKKEKPSTISYTVKKGDTLSAIAAKYGTTVRAIQQANGMSKGTTRLSIGQKLKIPKKSTAKKKSSKRKKRRR